MPSHQDSGVGLCIWTSPLENESLVDPEQGLPETSTCWSPIEMLESLDSGSKSGPAPLTTVEPWESYLASLGLCSFSYDGVIPVPTSQSCYEG